MGVAIGRRVLITGAGTGPANNLIRSLQVGDPTLIIVGCHHDRFTLKQSSAARNCLMYAPSHPRYAEGLRRILDVEQIDLVIPTSDADVSQLAGLMDALPDRFFLPNRSTIELCQDKCALAVFLRSRGLPAPVTHPLQTLEDVEPAFDRVAVQSRAWCRLRRGQGAIGAILVTAPSQAERWISLWDEIRGLGPAQFALSEYLPGRDIAAQTLWHRGRLVLIKTYERLTYLGSGNPDGFSSIAALSKTMCDPRVADTCARAIRAVDPEASGVFVFDFKEDVHGVPCITEINAGRFGMSTNIFDLPGKHNMAATYVRLALGEDVGLDNEYDCADEYYMVRDVDTSPRVYEAAEFFEDIQDARV